MPWCVSLCGFITIFCILHSASIYCLTEKKEKKKIFFTDLIQFPFYSQKLSVKFLKFGSVTRQKEILHTLIKVKPRLNAGQVTGWKVLLHQCVKRVAGLPFLSVFKVSLNFRMLKWMGFFPQGLNSWYEWYSKQTRTESAAFPVLIPRETLLHSPLEKCVKLTWCQAWCGWNNTSTLIQY